MREQATMWFGRGERMRSWCDCEHPKVRIKAITGGEVEVVADVVVNFHSDYLINLISVYCEKCGVEVSA